MYQSREKVYPREVHGTFQRLRTFAVFALLGLFYLLPWVPWDGRQAVLFDLPARQFYVFGITFWPQDFIYLTLLLVICALGLFFVTAVAGRVWCGYACPQTVWTEVFMWVERKIEGDRLKRMKLDKAPWTADKILKKTAKHSAWVVLGLWTGYTFVGFFVPITDLGARALTLDLGGWEAFWTLFYGFATWGNAGFLRENVCLYMCPYARFQSAMFDRDTLVISYDEARGEPRGPRKRGADPKSLDLGDCIDCTMCVQVCPTGIDIRDGLQYECIACGACIDACDQVMDKMGYPRGLIRYTTENALEGKPAKLLRPRVLIYAALLLVLGAAFLAGIGLRTPLRLDVIPDRNALYRMVDDGMVENVYTLKVMNMGQSPRTYAVEVVDAPAYSVETDPARIEVEPGEVRNVPARVRVDGDAVAGGGHDIRLRVRALDDSGDAAVEQTRFHTPLSR
ncbi:cytochrome c oxidase accessory protein CcoG [Salinisphaera sp. PC39]|uniref:cytochrome c oxidase accessory protein CcoG n=1 Tax=Salinisphaera sp. PC39 TaxID=1304156 RepID=UPI003341EE9A